MKFFDAAPRTGSGQSTVSPTVDLFIPGDTYAGAYSSTMTLAISSGP